MYSVVLGNSVFAELPDVNFVVPDDGYRYMRIAYDQETPFWDYDARSKKLGYRKDPPDNALPSTCLALGKGYDDYGEFMPLSREWQFFWKGLVDRAFAGHGSAEYRMNAWKSLVSESRAITDRHSPELGFTDFVSGRNLGGSKGPLAMKRLTFSGNIVRVFRDLGAYVVVEAINLFEPVPDIEETYQKPWLTHWCVQSTETKVSDGRLKNIPFPQVRRLDYRLGRMVKTGTPMPFIAPNGITTIFKHDPSVKSGLVDIEPGAKYSPYILERSV